MSGRLFPAAEEPSDAAPLAERVRPRRLADMLGQDHLVGADGLLTRIVASGRLPSLILWGPPGSGKTTLARLLARESGAEFFALSAVTSGVRDVREVVARARRVRAAGGTALLFVDEIHRFHRGQQDALLPHVENGTITFIGATTENPAHSVVAPLVSRCRVLVLGALGEAHIVKILERALAGDEQLRRTGLDVPSEVLLAMAHEADGDARRALGTLELAVEVALAGEPEGRPISLGDVREAAQRRLLRADRSGDIHYDLASAFIKSMRGSDPDAAVYYLMRMIESGEDPLFPARRMIIFAAEDVGLADPHALPLALAAANAFERLGLPEGTLPLAEAALYLATAPKSNSVIAARDAAADAIAATGSAGIPPELRDSSAALSRELGHGIGYRYPHDETGHHAPVSYLPSILEGRTFYAPSDQGRESEIAVRVEKWRRAVRDAQAGSDRDE